MLLRQWGGGTVLQRTLQSVASSNPQRHRASYQHIFTDSTSGLPISGLLMPTARTSKLSGIGRPQKVRCLSSIGMGEHKVCQGDASNKSVAPDIPEF